MALDPVLVKPESVLMTVVSIANGNGNHQPKSLAEPLPGELSIDAGRLDNGHTSFSTSPLENSDTPTSHSPPSSSTSEAVQEQHSHQDAQENMVGFGDEKNVVEEPQRTAFNNQHETMKLVSTDETELNTDDKGATGIRDDSNEGASTFDNHDTLREEKIKERQRENSLEKKMEVTENHYIEIDSSADSSPDNGSIASRESLEHTPVVRHKYLQNALRKPVNSDVSMSSQRLLGEKGSRSLTNDRRKNLRFSMRSPPHALGSLGSLRYVSNDQYVEDVKEIDVLEDVCNGSVKSSAHNRRDDQESMTSNSGKVKHASRGNMNSMPNNKVRDLELRVEKLERELTEAASIEISLYSIVAEHGSSMQKVHTPARRLSRLYIHASKQLSKERKASAARSTVSGLVLAAKACGNDVPRHVNASLQ